MEEEGRLVVLSVVVVVAAMCEVLLLNVRGVVERQSEMTMCMTMTKYSSVAGLNVDCVGSTYETAGARKGVVVVVVVGEEEEEKVIVHSLISHVVLM